MSNYKNIMLLVLLLKIWLGCIGFDETNTLAYHQKRCTIKEFYSIQSNGLENFVKRSIFFVPQSFKMKLKEI
jgi:hypothetical protein